MWESASRCAEIRRCCLLYMEMDVSSCEHTKLLRDNITKSNIHWCPTDMLKLQSQISGKKNYFFVALLWLDSCHCRKWASHSTKSAWNYSQINGVETILQLLKETSKETPTTHPTVYWKRTRFWTIWFSEYLEIEDISPNKIWFSFHEKTLQTTPWEFSNYGRDNILESDDLANSHWSVASYP